MISIWLFVALGVALVAVYLLGLSPTAHAIHATKDEEAADRHITKADGGKRRSGCCH